MTMLATDFLPEEATIRSIHDAYRSGKITCRMLTEAYLRRIEAYDKTGPALNTVISLNPKLLEIADELDARFRQSGFTGPLHGIPVLLKDNIDTDDMPTTGGSAALAAIIPERNAFIVQRMIAAGAIMLAKVNLHEFAVWGETASSILGQTLNPYDLTRTPGGSSGGTGAAVAANFGTVGIGTDTVNSVRSPASANCLVGLKPTRGLVSRSGLIPYALSQDTAGPITRTVEDAALVLQAIAGYDPADPATADSVNHNTSYTDCLCPNGLERSRIGVVQSLFGTGTEHQQVNAVLNQCIGVMKAAGTTIVDIEEPIDSNQLIADISVHLYELKAHLNSYLARLGNEAPFNSLEEIIASGRHHPDIEATIKQAVMLSMSDPEYTVRLAKQQQLRKKIIQLMDENNLDALLYPHQKRLVVPVGESQVERNGVLGAVLGFPAIVIPGGFSASSMTAPLGVPVGIELLGRPWSEPALLKIAYGFEQKTKFRRPPASVPPLQD